MAMPELKPGDRVKGPTVWFGDNAAGVVVSVSRESGLARVRLHADGQLRELLVPIEQLELDA